MSLDFSNVYDFETRQDAGRLFARAISIDGGESKVLFADPLDVSTSVPSGKHPG